MTDRPKPVPTDEAGNAEGSTRSIIVMPPKKKLESEFYKDVLKPELERRFPGIVIIKQDPNELQGVPDRLLLYEDKWAILETKRHTKSSRQPNQEYYVNKFNDMSFSRFVDPDNMQEVLDDLQQAFGVGG